VTTLFDADPKVFNRDLGWVPFTLELLLVLVELGGSDPGVQVLEVIKKGTAGGSCRAERVMF
jgi:hypothetical protein